MAFNIPETGQERIVIIGAGFAGLKLARSLVRSDFQIVLIDRNNYHQFQPLFYQVAMAGLEPSSISFPLRKIFQKAQNVLIRYAEIERIDLDPDVEVTITTGPYQDFDQFEEAFLVNRFDGMARYEVALENSQNNERIYLVLDEDGMVLCEE